MSYINFNLNFRVSFSNINPSAIQSGICTPITNYLNKKNFDHRKLNEMVGPKLNCLQRENEYYSNEIQNTNINQNNSDNNFNMSGISNFSLKNNTSFLQSKLFV